LDACLRSLYAEGTLTPDECIVVDDGSTDGSAQVAARYGCTVVRREERMGPAAARNLGSAEASGDILIFLDADVCVHLDAVRRMRDAFQADPSLDALIGSYDDEPGHRDFLSQYRNLLHHYVHQTSHREASTFWSGCGAIRRSVFEEHGGYDESYARPSIEDIELGSRLRQAGCRIELLRDIQVKHLKKWSLFGILKTDVRDRGIPWTELILRAGKMPNDLNLRISQRVSVLAVALLSLLIAASILQWGGAFVLPVLALLMLALCTYMVEQTNTIHGAAAIALLMVLLTWLDGQDGPPLLIAPLWTTYALQMLRRQFNLDRPAWPSRAVDAALFASTAAVLCLAIAALPLHWTSAALVALMALLITLNHSFYAFLAAKRGWLFMLAAIPFQLLFYFYSGFAFAAGVVLFAWRRISISEHLAEEAR